MGRQRGGGRQSMPDAENCRFRGSSDNLRRHFLASVSVGKINRRNLYQNFSGNIGRLFASYICKAFCNEGVLWIATQI